MRINLVLKSDKDIVLPLQHNHLVQAVILKHLDNEEFQKFIHDEGYQYEKRNYKMYSFSRLFGKFKLDKINKQISYDKEVRLTVSSIDERLPQYFLNATFSKEGIRLGRNNVSIKEVGIENDVLDSPLKVYTKSPITIHSTLTDATGKKKTYYYSPHEEEFNSMIKDNLIRKFVAMYGKEPENDEFKIEILNPKKLKERVLVYKGFIIKGWDGEFIIRGSKELINFAYNVGLGARNSQGFGCIQRKEGKYGV